MTTTHETHIDIGSNKLGYRRCGQGPDILFLHGWPLHKETYRDVAAALPDYTCHLLDFPGSGDSIGPHDEELNFARHTEATLAAIEKLGLTQFSIVGQDSGGLIARYVAHRLGDRVNALILTGTEVPGHHPKLINRLMKAVKLPFARTVTKMAMQNTIISKSEQLLSLIHISEPTRPY